MLNHPCDLKKNNNQKTPANKRHVKLVKLRGNYDFNTPVCDSFLSVAEIMKTFHGNCNYNF